MQRKPLNKKHVDILSQYSICNIDPKDCICLKYNAGETILQEGIPITYLMIIVSGKAKVCSTAENGRNLLLCYYISEGIIGDIELMTNSYVPATSIIALSDFECIGLPYQRTAADLKSNPEFLNRVGYELAVKLRESSKSHTFTALYSAEERLCSYILHSAQEGFFNEVLTDVSSSIGMSYRHMFRLLNRLCDEGILEKVKGGYLICDRKALIGRGAKE